MAKEFGPEHVQFMTLSLYIGLIIGASVWGILMDVVGRRLSFNATLFLAGVFGIAGGAAPSFAGLGGLLAALGVGLGGNLPVDGALFLEFIPAGSQYLLTLLSVFWSVGQLIASLIAWAFIANYSCGENESNVASALADGSVPCNPANNKGWRYSFYTFGAITMVCFIARFFIFRLPESPKYLLAKGRVHDAVEVMRDIARRNGTPLPEDVLSVEILMTAAGQEYDERKLIEEEKGGMLSTWTKNLSWSMLRPDLSHVRPLFKGARLAYNTTIIILLWGMIGLAYPLYNAFLPLYLTRAVGDGPPPSVYTTYRNYAIISVCGVPGSLIAAWLVELPRSGRRGAMSLGTVLTGVFLFAFTAARTDAQNLAFNCVTALTQNVMYGVLYGKFLAQTSPFAMLHMLTLVSDTLAYTPEVFPAPHRGTGDGIAASFNRVCGLMAPIIAIYATGNVNVPVYVAAGLFLAAGLLMLTLQVESRGKNAL